MEITDPWSYLHSHSGKVASVSCLYTHTPLANCQTLRKSTECDLVQEDERTFSGIYLDVVYPDSAFKLGTQTRLSLLKICLKSSWALL